MKKVVLSVFIGLLLTNCSEKISESISDKKKKERSILLFQQINIEADSQMVQNQMEVGDSLPNFNPPKSNNKSDSVILTIKKEDSIYSLPIRKKYLMSFSEDELKGNYSQPSNSRIGWGIFSAIGMAGAVFLFPFVLILGFAESLTLGMLLVLGGFLLIGFLGSYMFLSS